QCPRAPECRGFRPQSHGGSPSLVRSLTTVARVPLSRLVYLARRSRRHAAEQLAVDLRRASVDLRRARRPVVLPLLLRAATRPQLAESRRRAADVGGNAIL